MTKDIRRCVSCRKVALRSEFWRVVRCHPSKQITISILEGFANDLGDKLIQGRSVYLCPTAECLQLAQKKNRLGKSLKAAVGDDIYQQLASLLRSST
jgi:uncharacterized protein